MGPNALPSKKVKQINKEMEIKLNVIKTKRLRRIYEIEMIMKTQKLWYYKAQEGYIKFQL